MNGTRVYAVYGSSSPRCASALTHHPSARSHWRLYVASLARASVRWVCVIDDWQNHVKRIPPSGLQDA